MTKPHKRKPHPRPVMTEPEEIKVINEKGEVIHEATLTPENPVQAFLCTSKTWMHQRGVTPADVAERAIMAASAMLEDWINLLFDIDPKRAAAFMDKLDAEQDAKAGAQQ